MHSLVAANVHLTWQRERRRQR